MTAIINAFTNRYDLALGSKKDTRVGYYTYFMEPYYYPKIQDSMTQKHTKKTVCGSGMCLSQIRLCPGS